MIVNFDIGYLALRNVAIDAAGTSSLSGSGGSFVTDGQDFINQMTFDGMIYSFDLESQGNVTGYSISAIPEQSRMELLAMRHRCGFCGITGVFQFENELEFGRHQSFPADRNLDR